MLRLVRSGRKRYRLRRLAPIAALALAAAAAGVWAGARRPAPARAVVVDPPIVHTVHVVHATPALLTAAHLVVHRFTPPLTAAAAILVDAGSGRVLWQRNPHRRRHVASLTKIMTALLALRKLGPDDVVTVPAEAPRVPLVREGLRAGERVRAWKLFYSLLLYSGNDDALTLAVAAGGGDKWTFVGEMNAEARLLGLHDTHFSSPSGVVDRDNYSSAWDLAALSRVALRNERFVRIVRTRIKRVKWSPPTYSKIYVNNNLLLGSFAGANGIKTGYTHLSGPCLVASATRHGRTLVAVLLDDPNMYVDATRLLALGFRAGG
jgi:D-alanyl-D-alanine carboxypeptidase (penicillin-binding protein 5/6)